MARALLACAFLPAAAAAGGIDLSGQPVDLIFAKGRYAEIGFSRSFPSVDGTGLFVTPATDYGNIASAFTLVSGGVRFDIADRLSAAVLVDMPFGIDVTYPGRPDSTEFGGTRAFAISQSITGLLRYRLDSRWSVHGGLRLQRAEGNVRLRGRVFGLLDGYSLDLEPSLGLGWVAGVAYERPEIGLRVVLTYNSEITHAFDTLEGMPLPGRSTTKVRTPRSVNLDAQVGIGPQTLATLGVRWVEWSAFRIDPKRFTALTGDGLLNLQDTRTYMLGLAHRFDETWAGAVAIRYEEPQDDKVTPLFPTEGLWALDLGAQMALSERATLSAGLRYTWLGDALAETGTPDIARADFRDNGVASFGVRLGFAF